LHAPHASAHSVVRARGRVELPLVAGARRGARTPAAAWAWLDNNIMEHNAHHALPVIPLYNLQAAQRRLRAAFPDIQSLDLSPAAFCRIADACKLFDFDAR